jgi:hypothetical protein
MSNRVEQMAKVQTEGLELFRKKNSDYGDSFATYGPIGVIVRMGDKISRLNSVTNSGINLVNTESVRDTLIDLHNYSAMAIMLLDESPIQKNEEEIKFPTAPKHNAFSPSNRRLTDTQIHPKPIRRNALPAGTTSITNGIVLENRTPSPGPIIPRQNSLLKSSFFEDTNNQVI